MPTLRSILLLTSLLLALHCAPAEAFRCGNRIVVEGDDISHILHICGEPDAAQSWIEVRLRPAHRYARYRPAGLPVEIQVEQWTYNLGARRFMRRLRFENGRLVQIRELRYGH